MKEKGGCLVGPVESETAKQPEQNEQGERGEHSRQDIEAVRRGILESEDPLKPNLHEYYDRFEEVFEEGHKTESETFSQPAKDIRESGNLIKDDSFLNQLKPLTSVERVSILAQAAATVYISPDDLSPYFSHFPEDAFLILDACLTDSMIISPVSDWQRYQLGAKALEAAARSIPGYYEKLKKAVEDRDWRFDPGPNTADFLRMGEASKLARGKLLGDYKAFRTEILKPFGTQLTELTLDFLAQAENLRNEQGWGLADFKLEILSRKEYQELEDNQKKEFLKRVIEICHNSIIFHEVFDYYFSPANSQPQPYSFEIGPHSILYQTQHRSPAFEKPAYADFRTNYFARADEKPVDEYSYEKTIETAIAELGNVGSGEEVDFLMNFWDTNGHPAYGPAIAGTLSKIGPQKATEAILSSVDTAQGTDKRRLCSLLYRLELGKIGISEEGLNYLGRRFDLEDHNSSDNFAQRITPDGKVGIFDQDRNLSGFVQLESSDFSQSSASERIKKRVIDITYDMLFVPHPDETDQQRQEREKILKEFKQKFFDTYLNSLPDDAGFRFNNLSLREQGYVMQYLDGASSEDRDGRYPVF